MPVVSASEPDFAAHEENGSTDCWWAAMMLFSAGAIFLATWLLYLSTKSIGVAACSFAVELGFYFLFFWNLGVKERYNQQLIAEGISAPVWRMSRKRLIANQFKPMGTYRGLELLSRPVGRETVQYDGSEIIIRSDTETLAWVNLLRIHDEACWQRGWYEKLEIEGAEISLASIFESEEVRCRICSAQSGESDFVSLGLVSNDTESASENSAEELSNLRAKKLGEAMLSYSNVDARKSSFRAVGLGWSREYAKKNSEISRRQRAAVILAIVRRQLVSEQLPLGVAVEAVIQNSEIKGVLLSRYSFSNSVSDRLENSPIDFAGWVTPAQPLK